jgi:multisubunit Na+/H+ antiporter MnhE subunit
MEAQANSSRRRQPRASVGAAVSLLAWWGVLAGLWMLLVDTVSTAEVLCAVVAAAVGAIVTRLVFASETVRMRARASLAAAVLRQLARVPGDLWLLALVLARALAGRRQRGRFHRIALELPASASGNGRRAGIELAGSLAPNTIVLGVDERGVIVHQLVARHGERAGVVEIGS